MTDRTELEARTKTSALRNVTFVASLPRNTVTNVLGQQLLRAGTSVGANYREAARASSRAEFIHKSGLVEKEASETRYWLELLDGSRLGDESERRALIREAGELVAIFTAIGRTSKMRDSKHAPNPKSDIRSPK